MEELTLDEEVELRVPLETTEKLDLNVELYIEGTRVRGVVVTPDKTLCELIGTRLH
jgi:hypothetical protein